MGRVDFEKSGLSLVTETPARVPGFKGLGVTSPIPFGWFPEGTEDLWLGAGGQEEYVFPNLPTFDRVIAEAVKMVREDRVTEAISHVASVAVKSYEDKSQAEKWGHMAVQMPGDWGPRNRSDRVHLQETLTSKARGGCFRGHVRIHVIY